MKSAKKLIKEASVEDTPAQKLIRRAFDKAIGRSSDKQTPAHKLIIRAIDKAFNESIFSQTIMASKAVPVKKRTIISYVNLSPELLGLFNEQYSIDYSGAMTRIDKPDGDFFHVVPLETEGVSYMVKVNVKIDNTPEDELGKDYEPDTDDAMSSAEQITDTVGDKGDD